jgi:thioredoxin family protein
MLDFQALWNQALTYHDYVAASTQHKGLWEGIYRLARVPEWAHVKIPEGELVRLLVLAEDWCGDASNTIPIVAKWIEEVPGMELRVLRRDEHPEVMDLYLTNGTRSIPIVVLLNRDFRELGHWGPRPIALQEFVLERLGKVPKGELYPQTRRWYAKDHGETTIREILEVLNPS